MANEQTPEAAGGQRERTSAASGTSQYRRGADLERDIRDHLQGDGYFVIKSGGSKTPVDLAAFKPGQTLFIQVKRNGKLVTDEWNRLFHLCIELATIPLLATKPWRKPIEFYRLLRPRTHRSHTYPCELFVTDEWGAS